MKLRLVFFAALNLINSFGICQTIEDFTSRSRYYPKIYSKEHLFLFDQQTIKNKGFTSALAVKVSEPDDTAVRHTIDSCFKYQFDSEGRLIDRIYFTEGEWLSSGILNLSYEPKYEFYSNKKTTTVKTTTSGKVVTDFLFWLIENRYDTALVITTKFDKKGRIIESIVMPTNLYRKRIYCHEGEPPYHFRYAYDQTERLILDHDVLSGNRIQISYPFYGELLETFDDESGKILEREIVQVNSTEDMKTITTKEGSILLAFDGEGSKLIKYVTVIKNSGFPRFANYEIIYSR